MHTEMKPKYHTAIGNACFDYYYRADAWCPEGDKMLITPAGRKPGGMIPNAASVLAGYGDKTYLIDYMNSGEANLELQADLRSWGIDTSFIVTDDQLKDPGCLIIQTPKERTVLVKNNEKPVRVLPERNLELLRNSADVYTSMVEFRQFQDYRNLAEDLTQHGAKLVFDCETSTFQDAAEPLFDYASIVFFNELGAAKYVGRENALYSGELGEEAARSLLKRGAEAVVITLGAGGCEAFSVSEHVRIPGYHVQVLDTNGAGDTFNASFVHRYMIGDSLKEAAVFANAAAGRSVMHEGSKGGVAKEEEVYEFLRSHHAE